MKTLFMFYKLIKSDFIFIALMVLENLLLYITHDKHVFSQGINSALYFVVGLLISVFVIIKYYNKKVVYSTFSAKSNGRIFALILGIALLVMAFWGGVTIILPILSKIKIDKYNSDIIPMIQYQITNVLNHESPYKPVSFFGIKGTPTYLPMHYLPFIIPELLHIDYRWLPYSVCCLGFAYVSFDALRVMNSLMKQVLIAVICLLGFLMVPQLHSSVISDTIEVMIGTYYIIMISGLNKKNGYLAGIFMSFCLLSRFSLVFWIPLAAFVFWKAGEKKFFYQLFGIICVIVLILYVIPFLSTDWGLIFRGQNGYLNAAVYEWGHNSDDNLPIHLYKGVGFAYYFYSHLPNYTILERVKFAQKFQLVIPILVSILLGIWYRFNAKKIDSRLFLMGSFKMYITFFLFLIQVPYIYLMTIGNFTTLILIIELYRYSIKVDETSLEINTSMLSQLDN